MIFDKETVKGIFLERPDRFRAYIDLDGERILAHVPNTGRLMEILIPGVPCLIRTEDNPARKTKYSLIGAWKDGKLINFDSQMPNKVAEEALINGRITKLQKYRKVEREKTYGSSRFDFKLSDDAEKCYYLEVKGVTLENDGILSFPDAKTERGTKHLKELIKAKSEGFGAGVLFVIQMEDARFFTPNSTMDPDFGKALKRAWESGVDIMAYTCKTEEDSLTIKNEIPVVLDIKTYRE